MPETPKKDKAETRPLGSGPSTVVPDAEDASAEEDGKQREYYYDDSHGYEVYQGGEAEDDD